MKEKLRYSDNLVYTGFWFRVLASLIDNILILLITIPLLISVYGEDYFKSDFVVQGYEQIIISWILPAVIIVAFWIYKSTTPGKMAVSTKIIDAKTGGKPSAIKCIFRYFALILSVVPLGLGIFWIAFDKRKQGLHDKLVGTLVVRSKEV